MFMRSFIINLELLSLLHELSCLKTLASSKSSWQSQRNSLLTTAYVCSGAGLAYAPFMEVHFNDLGPWKFAKSTSLPPSKITGGTVALDM